MLASPDRWEPASPPAEADAAWVRVRNKREERLHATSRGGMQDSNASLAVGTVVALAIEPGGDGSVSVQLWTSTVNKHGSSGRIGAALEIRKRMRRFAKELASRDPTATVAHAEDG